MLAPVPSQEHIDFMCQTLSHSPLFLNSSLVDFLLQTPSPITMRLPTASDIPTSDINSTPHPIRHLKHILRHQNDHPGNTKLPARPGGSTSTEKLLFLSNSSISSSSVASGVAISGVGGAISGDRGSPPLLNICYTTNEVLVIIGVTCFLNFAFILLIMSCVHFFSTRASR